MSCHGSGCQAQGSGNLRLAVLMEASAGSAAAGAEPKRKDVLWAVWNGAARAEVTAGKLICRSPQAFTAQLGLEAPCGDVLGRDGVGDGSAAPQVLRMPERCRRDRPDRSPAQVMEGKRASQAASHH